MRENSIEARESPGKPDPVLLHSAGEGLWILSLFTFFLIWTVGYSYVFGYGPEAETAIVAGLPSWVAWGIALPWAVATVVSVVFATLFMHDDPLEDDPAQNLGEESHAGT